MHFKVTLQFFKIKFVFEKKLNLRKLPQTRGRVGEPQPAETKQEKMATILNNLKNRQTVVDMPVEETIANKEKYKQEYKDAMGLLHEVNYVTGVKCTSLF